MKIYEYIVYVIDNFRRSGIEMVSISNCSKYSERTDTYFSYSWH